MLWSVVAGSQAGRAFEAQWVLAVRRKTWESLNQRNSGDFRFVLPPRDRFYADPFLFEHQGRTYIFFEEYRYSAQKGVISCVRIDRSGSVSQPVTVLEAADHLSYPFIFEVDGQIYLMPESSRTGKIELYRSVRFPAEWRFDRVLIEQPGADATLWQQDGTFWLFVNLSAAVSGRLCEDLHVFFADSLDGEWIPHPRNPVVVDASGARPAGRLFLDGDQLIRPAQDCSSGYGGGIVLKRVLALSRTDYEEETAARIEPLPGTAGIHTLDHNGDFEVVDLKVVRLKTVGRVARAVRRREMGAPPKAH
jgi:hypothetical protein